MELWQLGRIRNVSSVGFQRGLTEKHIPTSIGSVMSEARKGCGPSGRGEGWGRVWVLPLAVFLLLVLQYALLEPLLWKGYPYEGWDEGAVYNNARVQKTPESFYTFRYGSFSSFSMLAAAAWYELYDDIGASTTHHLYSNYLPESLSDPYLTYKGSDRTYGKGLAYNYMRGMTDRYPIFLGRHLYLAWAYLTLAAVVAGAAALLGWRALGVAVAALWLSTSPVYLEQSLQGLPNAQNASVVFGIVVFSVLSIWKNSLPSLLAACAFFAMGLNLKADILPVAAPLGLAWLCFLIETKGRVARLRTVVFSGLSAFAAFWATRPDFFYNWFYLKILLHNLRVMAAGKASLAEKIRFGAEAYSGSLLGFSAGGWWVWAIFAVGVLVVALVVGVAVAGLRGRRAGAGVGLVVAAYPAFLAALPIYKANFLRPRYLLNGMASLSALLGLGIAALWNCQGTGRRVAVGLVVVLLLVFGFRLAEARREAVAFRSSMIEGLDPSHSRNRATAEALRLLETGRYKGPLLIDQHSYIDLRPFLIRGIDVRWIQSGNWRDGLASLPEGSRCLVLHTPGELTTANSLPHQPDMRWYDSYPPFAAFMKSLPVLHREGDSPMPLLSIAPVGAQDEVLIQEYISGYPSATASPSPSP